MKILYRINRKWYIFCFASLLIVACQKEFHVFENELLLELHKKTFNKEIIIHFNANEQNDLKVLLNNNEISIKNNQYLISKVGFYELIVIKNIETDTILFVILDDHRGETEWGLNKWNPVNYEVNDAYDGNISLIYPKNYPKKLVVPAIIKLHKNNNILPVYFTGKMQNSNKIFSIKRGVGSLNFRQTDSQTYNLSIGNKIVKLSMNNLRGDWIKLKGNINTKKTIAKGSKIKITKDLIINESGSLVIEAGAIIAIKKGVNIINNGLLTVNGNDEHPVVFTSYKLGKYWGGIISKGENNQVNIKGAIFCYSGFNQSEGFNYGHAKRQALFYLENTNFTMHNSYIIDNASQIFYSINSSLLINDILVQRAITG